jgi:hypothetical protein
MKASSLVAIAEIFPVLKFQSQLSLAAPRTIHDRAGTVRKRERHADTAGSSKGKKLPPKMDYRLLGNGIRTIQAEVI